MDISGRIRAVVERYGGGRSRGELPGGKGDEQGPAGLLWRCWEKLRRGEPWEELWERAFAGQGREGYLHRLDAETLLDAFVYEELRAIHAAYNIAVRVGKPEMMERVRRTVRWHVENTQPDHTTAEPWGLAAFAALDETGTFAELQLHAAEEMLGRVGPEKGAVTLALLADALLTLNGE